MPRAARVAHSRRSFAPPGLRPSNSAIRSLAGPRCPAPLAWFTRGARSHRRGFALRIPQYARVRGADAPRRSRGSLAALVRTAGASPFEFRNTLACGAPMPRAARMAHSRRSFAPPGHRPSNSAIRSRAGRRCPVPLAWLTRGARSHRRASPLEFRYTLVAGPRCPAPLRGALAALVRTARASPLEFRETLACGGRRLLLSRPPRSGSQSAGCPITIETTRPGTSRRAPRRPEAQAPAWRAWVQSAAI